jgi:imidazolonepropionase
VTGGLVFAPVLLPVSTSLPPLRGEQLTQHPVIRDAALAWQDGNVTYAGPRAALPASADLAGAIRVEGAVVPGFVDCHTHVPFIGWRADEFEARLAGRTYRDIHTGGGGGIYRSTRMLAEASDDDVIEFCRPLLDEMLRHGTTALEFKTGYGLSVDGELRQARLARRLAGEAKQTVTVTLLACHAIPESRPRQDWVDDVCHKLIPRAVGEGLVDAVDVYVEDIAFTGEDLERVAAVAREHGLEVRSHAEQLGSSGAAEIAAGLAVRSADHLNHISPAGIKALAGSPTIAALLPVSTMFLGDHPAPAGELMSAGAAIAVATDFNPGSSPCLSMPEAIAVGAALYRVPVAALLAAATLNAAWVLGLHEQLGSLESGKRADFVVLDVADPAAVAYRPGHNPVRETWIEGTRVSTRSGAVS